MSKLTKYKQIRNVFTPNFTNLEEGERDIALVEVTRPFKWTSSVKPACLSISELVQKYEGPLMVSVRVLVYNQNLVITRIEEGKMSRWIKPI